MVNGAQRVELPAGFGDHAVGVRRFGGGQQLFKESLGHAGHIAGDHDIPVRLGVAKRGKEAAQRTAILHFIGNYRQTQVSVSIHRADQRDISSRATHPGSDFLDYGSIRGRRPERQQRFIASHAPAGSPHQNEPRSSHEMILATSADVCLKETRCIVDLNNKVYICLIMAFAMLAASPSRAAELNPVSIGAPGPVVHKTTLVRADPRTGKLVRSVVTSSRPVISKIDISVSTGADVNAMVDKSAKAHDVDPLLVHSIIKVESNYNVHAVSNKGAQGLMQLTPSTARMLGVSNSFDPEQNIEAGVKYLKYLQDLYKDDRLALAAYNAGPGAVDKYKWIPPYAETRNYVYQVGKRYGEARRAADAAKPVAVPAAEVKSVAVPTEVKPAAVETFIDENGRLHLKTTQ